MARGQGVGCPSALALALSPLQLLLEHQPRVLAQRVELEADAQGVRGKATTPCLLARVSELTGGNSLASNIALVLNNASLVAQVAVAYAALGAAPLKPAAG